MRSCWSRWLRIPRRLGSHLLSGTPCGAALVSEAMHRVAATLLLGLSVASCGQTPPTPVADAAPAGTTRYVDERRGFEVTFPSGWQRARRVLVPWLAGPLEILSLGTVRPVANRPDSTCAQHPVETMRRVGPRDVFLTLQERTNQIAEGMEPGLPRLDRRHYEPGEVPDCLRRPVPFRTYWLPFHVGGRGFYLDVAVGNRVSARRRAQLEAVMASLRFRPVTVVDDRQRDIRFAYPRPWRVYPFRLAGAQLHNQVALGTFELDQARPDPGCMPRTALRSRNRVDGGLLFVFEYTGLDETQKRRFQSRPWRFRLDTRHPVAYECFGEGYLISWREPVSDRVFYALIYGPRRWVQQALGILDSFQISRQGE
jgi:hypothetical protein